MARSIVAIRRKNRTGSKNGKKAPRKSGCLAAVLPKLAFFLLVAGVFFYHEVARKVLAGLASVQHVEIDTSASALGINEGASGLHGADYIRNIAVFGLDTREAGKWGRSDTILIVSVGKGGADLKVISILRDTFLDIPGYGYAKINAAYASGGPQRAMAAINANFDMNVSDYVSVDFFAVASAIDVMGGVEVEVTARVLNDLNSTIDSTNRIFGGDPSPHVQTGTAILDGRQCVAYLRMRNTGAADFDRTARQRELLAALYKKFKANFSPILAADILQSFGSGVSTSFSGKDLLFLAYDLSRLSGETNTFSLTRHVAVTTADKQSVLMPDRLVDMAVELHGYIYGEGDYSPTPVLAERSRQLHNRY